MIAFFALAPEDATVVATFKSPDGRFKLVHCSSQTDTSSDQHAPYRDNIYFKSATAKHRLCTGDIAFAGSCSDFNPMWGTDNKLVIGCNSLEDVVTLVSRIHNIDVTLVQN